MVAFVGVQLDSLATFLLRAFDCELHEVSCDALPTGYGGHVKVFKCYLRTTIPKRKAVALLNITDGRSGVIDGKEEFCLAVRQQSLKILSENRVIRMASPQEVSELSNQPPQVIQV